MTVTAFEPTFCFYSTDSKAHWENLSYLQKRLISWLLIGWHPTEAGISNCAAFMIKCTKHVGSNTLLKRLVFLRSGTEPQRSAGEWCLQVNVSQFCLVLSHCLSKRSKIYSKRKTSSGHKLPSQMWLNQDEPGYLFHFNFEICIQIFGLILCSQF